MGLLEREREHEAGSSVSLNGIVSHLVPGEKYSRLKVDDAPVQEIELDNFQNVKQHKKYNKLPKLDEEEISLADDEEDKLAGENEEEETIGETPENTPKTGMQKIMAKLNQIQENNIMKIAWACTILGVICTGWIAPCFKLLGSYGVAAARRASWRSQVLLVLLIIPAVGEYRTLTPQQKRDLWNRQTIFQLILCAIFWLCDLLFWSNALDYTTVSRCSIFANTASLMIMVWSLIRKQPISWLEILGGVIGFAGLVFAEVGTFLFGKENQQAKNELLGDILALLSAASVAAYVVNATKVRTKVSVFVYTISNTIFLFVGLSTASFIAEGTKFDTSVDGIFGWTDPKYLIVVALLSVVAGLIGFNLNNVALRYMPPLGYSLVALCDPLISSTYAWLITSDGVPGVFTILGGLITLGGIVVLVVGQEKRKTIEKQQLQKEQEKEQQEEDEQTTDISENGLKEKVVVDFVASDGTAS